MLGGGAALVEGSPGARVWAALACLGALLGPQLQAQTPNAAGLGLSLLSFDGGGDKTYPGITGRVTTSVSSAWRLGVLGAYWPDLYDLGAPAGGWSVQFEGHYQPVVVWRGGPVAVLGLGYFHSSGGSAGLATAVGIGWQLRPLPSVAVTPQALLRNDDRLQDFELRFSVDYSTGDRNADSHVRHGTGERAELWPLLGTWVPVGGTYRVVEPTYGLRLIRRGSGRVDQLLGLDVLHVRSVPDRQGVRWDTRAVTFSLGFARALVSHGTVLDATTTATSTIVPEGPDRGASLGAVLGTGLGHTLRNRWLVGGMVDLQFVRWKQSGGQMAIRIAGSLAYRL